MPYHSFISNCFFISFFSAFIIGQQKSLHSPTTDRILLHRLGVIFKIDLNILSSFHVTPALHTFSCYCYFASFCSGASSFLGGMLTGLKGRWQYKSLILCRKRYSVLFYFAQDSAESCCQLEDTQLAECWWVRILALLVKCWVLDMPLTMSLGARVFPSIGPCLFHLQSRENNTRPALLLQGRG